MGLVIRSFAVDFFLEDMNTYKSFTIITDKPEQIYNFITITLHRGATVYHAEGLYEHTDKTVILTAQNKKQGIRLQEAIKQADPHAFVLLPTPAKSLEKDSAAVTKKQEQNKRLLWKKAGVFVQIFVDGK